MQAVFHLFRQLITLLLIFAAVLGIAAWLVLDKQPLLTAQTNMNADAVKQSKQLFSSFHQSIRDESSEQWTFAANTDELNAAFSLASRTWAGFRGHSELNDQGLTTLLTMPLQLPIGGYFLNVSLLIKPSIGPLQIEQVKLGKLSLPGDRKSVV